MIILSEVALFIRYLRYRQSAVRYGTDPYGKVRYGSVALILDVHEKKKYKEKHIGSNKKNGRGLVFSTDPADLLITNRQGFANEKKNRNTVAIKTRID
jgi:hypothetical protein